MVSLNVFFWIFVLFFGIIGLIRSWTKEILVSFAALAAIFIIYILEKYIPYVRDVILKESATQVFWFRVILISILVFFGYQTPRISMPAGNMNLMRNRFQDLLFGFILGAINGYLIIGSIWYYLHAANYPFSSITPPLPGTPAGNAAIYLASHLPPVWLNPPIIFIAVGLCFVFILVVLV